MQYNFNKTERLTAEDIKALIEDLGVYALGIKWGTTIVPVIILLTVLCWYFNWDGGPRFMLTGLSIMSVVGYIAIQVQTSRINQDLKLGVKLIDTFHLEKKIILGYSYRERSVGERKGLERKVELVIEDRYLQELVEYKKMKDSGDPKFRENSIHKEMLGYDFKFIVKNESTGEIEEFFVPIEYFIKPQQNEKVKISFAKRSRKVFKVE
jgi:hypothetical protein